MTLLLPMLLRGPVRRIRWRADSPMPVVAGDWTLLADGRLEAGYDADEFMRALTAYARETGRIVAAERIAAEVFGMTEGTRQKAQGR